MKDNQIIIHPIGYIRNAVELQKEVKANEDI